MSSNEKEGASRPKSTRGKAGGKRKPDKRLRPGQLDILVLGYMKKNRTKLPVTAGTVAHGVKRSSGAVANCLGRLEQAEKVRLVEKKPRRYDLAGSTK